MCFAPLQRVEFVVVCCWFQMNCNCVRALLARAMRSKIHSGVNPENQDRSRVLRHLGRLFAEARKQCAKSMLLSRCVGVFGLFDLSRARQCVLCSGICLYGGCQVAREPPVPSLVHTERVRAVLSVRMVCVDLIPQSLLQGRRVSFCVFVRCLVTRPYALQNL